MKIFADIDFSSDLNKERNAVKHNIAQYYTFRNQLKSDLKELFVLRLIVIYSRYAVDKIL